MMMGNKDLYPKAVAVYEAILGFMSEGVPLSDITIAKVAKRAGIGKGTTYEYFESKEVMIYKTMIYGYDKMIQVIFEPVLEQEGFRGKMQLLYKNICAYKNMGVLFDGFNQAKPYLDEHRNELMDYLQNDERIFRYIRKFYDDLYDTAVKEKLVRAGADQNYITYVFTAAMQLMWGPMVCIVSKRLQLDADEEFEYIMKPFLAALKAA